jgi:8-oxo-dGTP pyrophosphatase MutT (NUDIX family)
MTTNPTTPHSMDKTAIRDAATVILWRSSPSGPEVLMGQRGANAAFMPAKYVFPGGAVDAADASVPLATALPKECAKRLTLHPTSDVAAHTLAAAAIRELWEETGLTLGNPGHWAHPPMWTMIGRALPHAGFAPLHLA